MEQLARVFGDLHAHVQTSGPEETVFRPCLTSLQDVEQVLAAGVLSAPLKVRVLVTAAQETSLLKLYLVNPEARSYIQALQPNQI